MLKYCELTGKRFVFIIDEWDAIIREAKYNTDVKMRYINILRGWFKNGNFTPRAVAAAYMTGSECQTMLQPSTIMNRP